MKVRFNFNLETWMRHIEVEANSYDEALEELYKMSLSQMLEVGVDDETTISDIDGEIIEKTLKVKAYDFEWDIEEDDYDSPEEYNSVINSLPEDLTLTITVEPNDDEEGLIADEITFLTNQTVKDFRYVVIEER